MTPEPRYERIQQETLRAIDLALERGIDIWMSLEELLAWYRRETVDPHIAGLAWAKGADTPYTISEVEDLLGEHHLGPGEVVSRGIGEEDVGVNYCAIPSVTKSDIPPKIHKRMAEHIWREAQKLFPYPTGKPWVKGVVMHTMGGATSPGATAAVNMLVPTWKNPVNAQARRRSIYYRVVPRMLEMGRLWEEEEPEPPNIYKLEVAADDWSAKYHEALTRKISRHGGEGAAWCWLDTFGSSGRCVYFTNVAMEGWTQLETSEEVEDALGPPHEGSTEHVKHAFAEALKGIRYPPEDPPARFRPFRGSKAWTLGADNMNFEDEDEGRWWLVGVKGPDSQGKRETDFTEVEVAAIAEGWVPETINQFWKFQWQQGIKIKGPDARAAAEFAVGLGYRHTRAGRWVLGLEEAASKNGP